MVVDTPRFPSEHTVIEQFIAHMRDNGIEFVQPIIADGKRHRYDVVGDRRGSKNGWAILHIDAHPAGRYGSWKLDVKYPWKMKGAWNLSAAERREMLALQKAKGEQRDREQAQEHAEAAARAQIIYDAARPLDIHPYLTAKGVQSNPRLRVGDWSWVSEERQTRGIYKDVLIVPIWDFARQMHSLEAILPDKETGGFKKRFLVGGDYMGYSLALGPPVDDVLLICEGLSTGLSLWQCTGHCVVVAFTAGNLVAVAEAWREQKGIKNRRDYRIVICADNDQWPTEEDKKKNRKHRNTGLLAAKKAAIAVNGTVVYPEFTDGKHKDFNDLHQLKGEAIVRQMIENVLKPRPADRPQIIIAGGSRHLIVDRAEQIMAGRDDIFKNSGRLVRVAEAKDIGEDEDSETKDGRRNFTDPRRTLMGPVAKEWLTTELTRDIEFVKSDGRRKDEGYINKDAPDWLAPALIEHKVWPNIRELAGITSAPILCRDGTVRVESGYDPETGMLLIPRGAFLPVPEKPTHGDAVNALQVLKEPFKYYTFATDAGVAAALSLVLSKLARHLVPLVPFHLVTAPKAGSGKGYIIEVASIICDGVRASLRGWPKSEEELRKALTSSVMASQGIVCFDNIESGLVIISAILDSFLTAQVWEDRILGVNKNIQATNNLVLTGTGNNVRFGQDGIRRVIDARILTESETPWLRKFEWTPPDYARSYRAELLQAACTLISAFIQAGEPEPSGIVPLASFEPWSQLVRNSLIWVGLSDPCATQEEFIASDSEQLKISELLKALRSVFGTRHFSATEVLSSKNIAILDMLKGLFQDDQGKPEVPTGQRIGRLFATHRDSPVDGLRLSSEYDKGVKVNRWFVKETSQATGSGG